MGSNRRIEAHTISILLVRQFLTSNTMASTIRMLRSTFPLKSFLLVEGAVDARLWVRFTHQDTCFVQLCYNRANVVQVVAVLHEGGFVGHLGLIDHDFAELLGEQFASRNLITTDPNDLEVLLFQSDVFERFVGEFCNADKVISLQAAKGAPLRGVLIASASIIGTLRYLSRLHRWNLVFEDMTYRFPGRRDLDIDVRMQILHLRGRSQGTSMPVENEVMAEIERAKAQFPDLLQRVCGHDLCEIISKAVHACPVKRERCAE
jgi:Protein of unknown function (DUF4435)